jgi:hypothetical protein
MSLDGTTRTLQYVGVVLRIYPFQNKRCRRRGATFNFKITGPFQIVPPARGNKESRSSQQTSSTVFSGAKLDTSNGEGEK